LPEKLKYLYKNLTFFAARAASLGTPTACTDLAVQRSWCEKMQATSEGDSFAAMNDRTEIETGFLAGGGEMGELIRTHSWAGTSLGPPALWPASLKTAIRIMLTSRQPIWIGWGSELIFFYNDAYRSIVGGKHPTALGEPTSVVWHEIWDEIGPMLATAMSGEEGTYVEEQLLIMERNGYPEETYYTFSYSPIPDGHAGAGGIICANSEDTRRVIGERQLTLLRDVATRIANSHSWQAVAARAMEAIGGNPKDIPFACLFAVPPGTGAAELIGAAGIEPGHEAAKGEAWPLRRALSTPGLTLLDCPAALTLPGGAWSKPPERAVLARINLSGPEGLSLVLALGLNPFRLFDDSYRHFAESLAQQIETAIASVRALEEERRRGAALMEIDRAKTTFFANISHEFRTPLTLMLGPMEDALAAPHEGVVMERETAELIHRNGLRLQKLVNNLLDFSRIEAGRVQTKTAPVDLAVLTADIASGFRSMIERAGLAYIIECPPLPCLAVVDPEMWEKITLNLLSNAYKFTFSGQIALRLETVPDGVQLTVADTGIGVPEAELPRLFERFHRVEGAKGRSIEGSGIGLALVQELVRLQGGRIEASSRLGEGTMFAVTMPCIPPGADGAGQKDAPAAQVHRGSYVAEAARWDGADKDELDLSSELSTPLMREAAAGNILVADDNPDLRHYMLRLLRGQGYHVEVVANGGAALTAVQTKNFDIVISDVMMPGLDGVELLRALRADAALRELPVILLSAQAGEEARVSGLQAGADDYLTKPFSGRDLLARVSSTLKLAALRRETAERLREDARSLELLNKIGIAVAAELDTAQAIQLVTDAARELTGAAFGAFFYNAVDEAGELYQLYTLSGAPREAFAGFPMPRSTPLFRPSMSGERLVRSDDILADPLYGKNAPFHGMPKGHLPVRSYLAAPVHSRSGEVLGTLFFGHPEPGKFGERTERLLIGIAAQAAIAIDNSRLYQAAQAEVAERKKAEAALRELNETLESRVVEAAAELDRLWELSEDLLALADADGRLLRVSPSWQEQLGHRRVALLEKSLVPLFHPDDAEELQALLIQMQNSRVPAHFEARMRTADGDWRWIDWTFSPDPDSARLHGVGRDVTDEKESAAALAQAEAALHASQKMDAIGKLTGGVAHDFNNLLQVIGGNLQLLAKDVAGRERAETRLHNALAGVSRGAKLASQLLSFGRRQPLTPKVVNLGRFVRGLDDMLRRALGDGIEIETIVSGGLWNSFVDPFQVENALLNLAINARDAMQGHGRLTIEAGNAMLDDDYRLLHSDVIPGQYIMVAVTDTGCGMTPDVIERVFEPFFTTKPEGQGTGLGLSMVYGFVKQSEGHIKIYSEPGHGTTVRIYLPRVREEEDVVTDTEPGPVTGGSETVLVVEDDEDVRGTVVELLSELGYRVLKAKDAQSALAIVESGVPIDVLFSDVVMPGPLRSPELARKARERLPGVAVLFTSGYTENAIVHAGRLDEGIELLSKPYTREALARKLRAVLRSAQLELQVSPLPPAEPLAPRSLRVLLVEDEEVIRMVTEDNLADLGHTVNACGTVEEALALLEHTAVDVLLTDINLPGRSGTDLAALARQRRPGLRVIFVSGYYAGSQLKQKSGLSDIVYLQKPYSRENLANALAEVTG
jgi:PAS domain S-box-containing protein